MAESKEELKSFLMQVKEESEKAGFLKLNIQKSKIWSQIPHGIWSHHFMANRWGNNGNSVRLSFLGLQKSPQMVTAAMKLKDTYLLLWRNAMTNLKESESESCSVLSDSLELLGLYSPWNFPGQNTGMGNCSLFQGIFPTQGSNPGLPQCRQILYQLSHQGSPWTT